MSRGIRIPSVIEGRRELVQEGKCVNELQDI